MLGIPDVLIWKLAEVAVAGTKTDAGTIRSVPLRLMVTVAPPEGAALLSFTVQVVDEFSPREAELQEILDTEPCVTRLITVLTEAPLYVDVMVETSSTRTDRTLAVKVIDVLPDSTVTEVGTFKSVPVRLKNTFAPPEGAGFVSVTVHVDEAFSNRKPASQETEDMSTGATREIENLLNVPL